LVRKWADEGMVTKRGRLGALVEADHCLDVLVAHKFVMPKDTVTGKVKSYVMRDLIHELITKLHHTIISTTQTFPSSWLTTFLFTTHSNCKKLHSEYTQHVPRSIRTFAAFSRQATQH
jgi:hypothetical protein